MALERFASITGALQMKVPRMRKLSINGKVHYPMSLWICSYCKITRPNHTHWDIVQNFLHNSNIDDKSYSQ
jgi:hypothetical protein